MIMHLASKSTDCTVQYRAISRPYRLRKTSSKQSKRRDLHLSDYIVRQTIIHFVITSGHVSSFTDIILIFVKLQEFELAIQQHQ